MQPLNCQISPHQSVHKFFLVLVGIMCGIGDAVIQDLRVQHPSVSWIFGYFRYGPFPAEEQDIVRILEMAIFPDKIVCFKEYFQEVFPAHGKEAISCARLPPMDCSIR